MNLQLTANAPILLSSFVWPGVGQFFQRRRLAGMLYGCCFSVGMSWFLITWVKLMVHYYKLGFEFETYEPEAISLSSLLRPFFVALGIYLLSLIDVTLAQYRLRKKSPRHAQVSTQSR